MSTGIGQVDTDLAVLSPARRSGVLALDAGGPDARLQEAGVVHDQDRFGVAEMLDHIATDVVEDIVGFPVASIQQPVHPVRSRVTSLLSKRPPVLPLQRGYQPPHIGKSRLPRLRPGKPVHTLAGPVDTRGVWN